MHYRNWKERESEQKTNHAHTYTQVFRTLFAISSICVYTTRRRIERLEQNEKMQHCPFDVFIAKR